MGRWLILLVAMAVGAAEPELHPTLKLTALGNHAPDDALLYPERDTVELLGRLRLELGWQPEAWVDLRLAYEQRARWTSAPEVAGSSLLPADERVFWRIEPLDWELATDDDGDWRHEIDRGYVAFHPGWGEVTVGRQAIGLGRGVLFGAVDLFAPFAPLEVDREWRRGVDAARLEYRLSPTSSAELIGAFGESADESAAIGRLRGYLGRWDAELLAGRRARDELVGMTVSGAVADAELHAEAAWFHTPEAQPDDTAFGGGHDLLKAVLGGSYTVDVGSGLTVLAEYHYSDFGMRHIEDLQPRLATDAAFRERALRGDMQILGRHAYGLQASYSLTETWSGSLTALGSPVDGSGVLMPGLRWDATTHLTALATVYLPWGERPDDGRLQSEYGGNPQALYLQLSLYY